MNADLDFVHLHNHTEYSLLDGMTRITGEKDSPSPLLLELSRQGAKGVAITDHGNMYGAIEFYLRCRKAGLKPIIGCEMYMSKGSRREKSGSQRDNRHITVLARDFEGYQNLMALSSKAFLEGFYYDARIDRELLAEHAQGLIVLSGCLKGELAQTLLNGDLPGAVRMAGEYRDILGPEGYYLEMMDHGIQAQKQVLKGLLEVHEKTGIPWSRPTTTTTPSRATPPPTTRTSASRWASCSRTPAACASTATSSSSRAPRRWPRSSTSPPRPSRTRCASPRPATSRSR